MGTYQPNDNEFEMNKEQTMEILDLYIGKLHKLKVGAEERTDFLPTCEQAYKHILWMCYETKKLLKEDKIEKAGRWLGFIQGVLWMGGTYRISEMRDHNR